MEPYCNVSGRNLTTLVGLPFPEDDENDMFDCDNNLLTTLDGCPWCYEISCNNNRLVTLEGCPDDVQIIYCDNNQLTSLKGCRALVAIYCNNNLLTTLGGCYNEVEYLYCSGNRLATLDGCPWNVKELDCFHNQITTLIVLDEDDGFPSECLGYVEDLNISHNQITDLQGCPGAVKRLDISYNQLATLVGLPASVEQLNYEGNPLHREYVGKTIEEIHQVNKTIAVTLFIENRAAKKIQKAWGNWWVTPQLNKEGYWEAPCARRSYLKDVVPHAG